MDKIKVKEYGDLRLFKYTNKVFYNNLWDEETLESRGRVEDSEGNVILLPFRKVFNYKENGTLVPLDQEVEAIKKMNGFMASATTYKGELLVGTTGTLDSKYAKVAEYWVRTGNYELLANNYTYLFEICDYTDPHIIKEEYGCYLIGVRCNLTGKLLDESDLDTLANILAYSRPEEYIARIKFSDLLEKLKTCKHEGYMVRSLEGDVLCKLKSPYYLSTKALARLSKTKLSLLRNNPEKIKERIDEEFYDLVQYIHNDIDNYEKLTEQERIAYIKEYFKCYT